MFLKSLVIKQVKRCKISPPLYLKRNSRKSRKVINAKARFENGQYTVLKGSTIERIDSTTIPDHIREARIKAAINENGILLEDVSFGSPSSAAGFVIGGVTNGKTDWKTKDGEVLKNIIEKNIKT